MSACPCGGWCACHTNPVYPPPCDVPGGCGLTTYTAHPDQPAPECAATGCTRTPAAGSTLCAVDGRRLGDWLARIDTEYALLDTRLSMQARQPGAGGSGRLPSERSPASLDAIVLRDQRRGTGRIGADDADDWGLDDTPSVFATLHSWAETVRDERDLSHVLRVPPCQMQCPHLPCRFGIGRVIALPHTVLSERKLLADQLDQWILGRDWAGEFFDEIRGLWALLLRANGHGAPARRLRRMQAPCTACGVRAVTHRPGDDLMQCQNCQATAPYASDDERVSA